MVLCIPSIITFAWFHNSVSLQTTSLLFCKRRKDQFVLVAVLLTWHLQCAGQRQNNPGGIATQKVCVCYYRIKHSKDISQYTTFQIVWKLSRLSEEKKPDGLDNFGNFPDDIETFKMVSKLSRWSENLPDTFEVSNFQNFQRFQKIPITCFQIIAWTF